jgi:hypothetical protein
MAFGVVSELQREASMQQIRSGMFVALSQFQKRTRSDVMCSCETKILRGAPGSFGVEHEPRVCEVNAIFTRNNRTLCECYRRRGRC